MGKWLDHRGTVCSQARLCWAAQCIEMHVGGYIYSHGQYSHSPKSCSNNNHGVGFLPMPISSLPVMCRSTISNQHAQAQSLHNQMLHTCWQSISKFTNMETKRWTRIRSSTRCLTWHALATAELIQHVVLLIWQALLDAICDYTVNPRHSGS